MNKPTISIACITYNQEDYIGDAINSWLLQKINVNIELVICDDNSTDNTYSIITHKLNKLADTQLKVRCFKNERNLGVLDNFLKALLLCEGKYIALCEGDDYWTDPYKLQKQYDIISKKENVSLVFHNANVEYSNGETHDFNTYTKTIYNGEDLFKQWLIPTASAFFINVFKTTNYINTFQNTTHPDLSLFLLVAEYGDFYYIDKTMSVYRKHEGGIMNSFKGLKHNRAHLIFLSCLKQKLGIKYSSLIKKREFRYIIANSYLYAKESSIKQSLKHCFKALSLYPILFLFLPYYLFKITLYLIVSK